jgi:hypothetical protein
MRRWWLLAAVLGTAALTASCGGDTSLSRDELASRANEICTKYEKQLDALAEPQSIEDVEQLAKDAEPIVEEGVDELDGLQPPENLERDYDRWIELNRDNVDLIRDLREAAASGQQVRVQQVVQQAGSREQEADRLATKIGLDECAND